MQTNSETPKPSPGRKLVIEGDRSTVAPPAAAKPQASQVQLIPVEKVKPSPFNARKDFPQEYINELAASIGRDEQQQPGKVRPKNGGFELIFGECRWRACTIAGVPFKAFVEEMDDAKAEHLCLIENLKRRDLTVFEEAEKLKRLHEVYKVKIDDLAVQVGLATRTVRENIKLAGLQPKVRELVMREKEPLSLSNAKLVSRLSQKDQEPTAKFALDQQMTHEDLEEYIRTELMVDLRFAPFDVKQKGLPCVAATCAECPKRSGNAREEFPDLKGADICTSPADFRLKCAALLQLKASETGAKVLSAKEVEKQFTRWGDFQGLGYVKANDKHPADAKGRTYKNLLDKEEVSKRLVLALTPKNELLELLDNSDLQSAIKRVGKFEKEKAEPSGAGSHLNKAAREKRDADDVERGFRLRVANTAVSALIERIEKKGPKRQHLQVAAHRLMNDSDFYYGEPRGEEASMDPPERRGWKTPDEAAAAILKMKENELIALIFETALGWNLRGVYDGYSVELKESLKAVGLDVKKFESDEKQLAKDEAKAKAAMEKDLQAQMDAAVKKGGGK